jgi:hypothetical protein
MALFDYPDGEEESSAALCADGTDNDYDGAVDCADLSCDGFCAEDDETSCSDGRDNDGDGLPDSYDPRCWHLAGPEAVRCASTEPTDFEERFDGSLSDSRWSLYGGQSSSGEQAASIVAPTSRAGRPDTVLSFATAGAADDEAVLASTAVFDGEWGSFEIAFQAQVATGGLVRVALVPSLLAPDGSAPVAGAELSGLGIEIDERNGSSVALIVDGQRHRVAAQSLSAWRTVTLTGAGETLALRLGSKVILETARPSLAAARLVVWGASDHASGDASRASIDDLRLQIAGQRPCAFGSPQIPFGSACPLDGSLLDENVGHTVSLAHDERTDRYCAVLTSSDLGAEQPSRAQVWTSDGDGAWTGHGHLPLGDAAGALVGVAVTRDTDGELWRAAIVVQDGDEAQLYTTESADCADWSDAAAAVNLPVDAEAPSYLFPGVSARHEVYFTRPAAYGREASLWRARSHDGETFALEDEMVTVFPLDGDLQTPVAISRAGSADVVLTHRTSPESGTVGLGLWVATDERLTEWRRSSEWPLIEFEPTVARFDSESILAGAISWQQQAPFLLYGADGEPLSRLHRAGETATITAGTAALRAAGMATATPGDVAVSPPRPGLCGDGECDDSEACASCPADCGVCEGERIYVDRFESADGWTLTSEDVEATPSASLYWSSVAGRLNLAAGESGWLAHPLEAPLAGDFELSFDVHWEAPLVGRRDDRCTAFVGLARVARPGELDPDGVFVRLDQQLPCQPLHPSFTPSVRTRSKQLTSLAIGLSNTGQPVCTDTAHGLPELWHRVTLTKRDGKITVAVAGRDSCADLEKAVSLVYPGPMDRFASLLVGRSPSWTPTGTAGVCDSPTAALSIDNVVVRKLPCPEGGEVCTLPDSDDEVCVDLESTPEHCGACNAPVEPIESCRQGHAVCAETECLVGGTDIECADLATDPRHCGGCGQAVGPLEGCGNGVPQAAMKELPEGFAIDVTEVTRAQYAAWLATEPSTQSQPDYCAWNDDFEPGCGWPPDEDGSDDALAVGCVDWCDARAYCAGVGKRLCGKVGGGPVSIGLALTSASQWFSACSSGDSTTYPYGDDYEPKSCNGEDNQPVGSPFGCTIVHDVAAQDTCQSDDPEYAGVFDLSGNALEWVDSCTQQQGAADICMRLGGGVCDDESGMRCDGLRAAERSRQNLALGFRCCRD